MSDCPSAMHHTSSIDSQDEISLYSSSTFLTSRIDEKNGDPWNLPRVAVDALGAAMLVTIILDLWRIFLGPIVPVPESGQCNQPGLVWFQMPGSFMQNESS